MPAKPSEPRTIYPDDPSAAELAFDTVLQRKGRVLDVMTDHFAAARSRTDDAGRELLLQLRIRRSGLAKLLLDRGAKAAAVAAQREAVQELEADLNRRSDVSLPGQAAMTTTAVRAAVPEGTALVDMFVYRPEDLSLLSHRQQMPHYGAFVLKRGGAPRAVDLGETRIIDALVKRYRSAVGDSTRDPRSAGRALFEAVVAPIEPLLGEVRRVRLSPDGLLNLVPFAALTDRHGRYLVERYHFSYLSSGRDLAARRPPPAPRGPPVLVGDPAFGAMAGVAPATGDRGFDMKDVRFSPLPATSQEVTQLKARMPGAKLLTGDDAGEAAIKALAGPRILHLATHGFFLPGLVREPTSTPRGRAATLVNVALPSPRLGAALQSGLAFARANERSAGANERSAGANERSAGEDGVLTAYEAATLRLPLAARPGAERGPLVARRAAGAARLAASAQGSTWPRRRRAVSGESSANVT